MKSHSSDENTGYNQTTTTNTYLNDHNHHHLNGNTFNYHQHQHRVDSKHNLKLEHFKFSPSNKSMTPQNSAITNTLSHYNGANSSTKKNVLLTIQNQNLLVHATLNASIQAISTNNVSNGVGGGGSSTNHNNNNSSRHKILRNKVFNNSLNSTNSNNNNNNYSTPPDIHNESDVYVHSSHSTNPPTSSQQQQQAMQQKLTYLKRYVANGLANKNSLQFSDGYWNRIPGSKLKTTTIRTNNSNNQINVLASFSNNGNTKFATSSNFKSGTANGMQKASQNNNFISLQNVNGQLLPNRELSIIDLQLPMRKQQNSPNNTTTTQHHLVSLNKGKTKTTDYYTSNSQHSHASDTSEHTPAGPPPPTQSKIMLTAMIKPQLNMNNQEKNNTLDTQFTEISQFFNSNDTSANVSGGYELLLANDKATKKANDMNMANIKNKNYFKYVMNQQKKRQENQSSVNNGNGSNMNNSISNETLNSPNVSNIMPPSSFNKRQVQMINHEVPMHSNLNNISSNALLIRRLKF